MDFGTFKSKMRLNEVRHDELISILLHHFGHLSSDLLPGDYIFEKKDNTEVKLILGINKYGKIVSIKSENVSKEEFSQIEEQVFKTLVEKQPRKIAQATLFSTNLKFEGYFNYKDEFQLLPTPADAPSIDQIVGDHPFIIQFVYDSSPDIAIDNSRRKQKEIYLARLLHFFVKGYIKHWPYFSSSTWIYEKEFVDGDIVSRFAQEGYHVRGHKGIADSFDNLNDLKRLDCVAPEKYYRFPFGENQENHKLLLPDNLSNVLDKAFSLKGDDKEKFDRAVSWYYQSGQIWTQSHSSSFVALVTALECLFEQPVKCPVCNNPIEEALQHCDTCGQPMYKITRTLKEFLQQYVPFIEQMDREQKVIYKIRSDLAHGLSMFSRDIEPGLFLRPIQQHQNLLQRNIQHIVFVAVYNWLFSRQADE